MAKAITVTGFEGAHKGTFKHGMKKQVLNCISFTFDSTRISGRRKVKLIITELRRIDP